MCQACVRNSVDFQGHTIPVSNQLLPLIGKMGAAVGLFLWCVNAVTKRTSSGQQKVLGGMPTCDSYIARSLDCSRRTIQRWRKILLDLKTIIEATRTGHGFIYTVLLYSKKKDLPLETPRRERQERTNLPTLPDNSGGVRSDKTVHQIGQDGASDATERCIYIESVLRVQESTGSPDSTLPSEKNSNPSVTFTTPPAPSVDTSIQTARDTFKRKFGRDPLPRGKNGFYTGWTKALVEHGDALVQETLDIWISDPQTEEYLRGKKGKNGEVAGLSLFLKQCLVEKTNSFLEDARNNLRVPTPEEIQRDTKEEYGEGQ